MDIVTLLRGQGVEPPRLRCIDVGAMHIGRNPWDDLVDRGHAESIGFEPNPDECARLAGLARPGRRFLPLALGDGQSHPLHICHFSPTSSLLRPHAELIAAFTDLDRMMQVERTVEVQTRRLDDLPELLGSDFIKLDTQGSELMILQHGLVLLAGMLVVQVEVEFLELYEGQPLFAEVDRFMRAQGFLLHTLSGLGSLPFKPMRLEAGRGLRQLLWADAVYVRDFRSFAALPAAALLKLAILLHVFYGSFDLALVALRQADAAEGSELGPAYMAALRGQRLSF